jgi:Fe-S-cluster containining protein
VHAAVTPKDIECRGGCDHCCHLFVSATAPEVFLVARSVRGEGATTRLRATETLTRPLSIEERARAILPCPFLADGLCGLYGVRPTPCRSTTSLSARSCEAAIRQGATIEVPFTVPPQQARSTVLTIFRAALRASRLAVQSYELNSAVVRALDEPDAERRWLGGEDVFNGVQIDPASLTMRADDVAAIAARLA